LTGARELELAHARLLGEWRELGDEPAPLLELLAEQIRDDLGDLAVRGQPAALALEPFEHRRHLARSLVAG
jgi:hypothetical protein